MGRNEKGMITDGKRKIRSVERRKEGISYKNKGIQKEQWMKASF